MNIDQLQSLAARLTQEIRTSLPQYSYVPSPDLSYPLAIAQALLDSIGGHLAAVALYQNDQWHVIHYACQIKGMKLCIDAHGLHSLVAVVLRISRQLPDQTLMLTQSTYPKLTHPNFTPLNRQDPNFQMIKRFINPLIHANNML